MNVDEVKKEYLKCSKSPYYFATTYLKIQTDKGLVNFTTPYSEKDFNDIFNNVPGTYTDNKKYSIHIIDSLFDNINIKK